MSQNRRDTNKKFRTKETDTLTITMTLALIASR